MVIAENLQLLRKRIGLSQEELAERCQVSRQAVTKWETGESIPALDKLVFLADMYDVSLDELVGRIERNPYDNLMELVKEFAVDDIPTDEEDDISAIVSRYMLFANSVGLDASDVLRGLEEIFLNIAMKEEKKVLGIGESKVTQKKRELLFNSSAFENIILEEAAKGISVEKIIAVVTDEYMLKKDAIISKSREPEAIEARMLIMYFMKHLLNKSNSEIADCMKRDISAVIFALGKVDELIATEQGKKSIEVLQDKILYA
ncbi:MAG: helix-turn-helix domain-containing protein [Lachnospiraceae bacterium]|nr:helix-turn-helix domain-containing protein [Lachnospiraceae bacterium]